MVQHVHGLEHFVISVDNPHKKEAWGLQHAGMLVKVLMTLCYLCHRFLQMLSGFFWHFSVASPALLSSWNRITYILNNNDILNQFENKKINSTHRFHVWYICRYTYIYLHLADCFGKYYGKYTIYYIHGSVMGGLELRVFRGESMASMKTWSIWPEDHCSKTAAWRGDGRAEPSWVVNANENLAVLKRTERREETRGPECFVDGWRGSNEIETKRLKWFKAKVAGCL